MFENIISNVLFLFLKFLTILFISICLLIPNQNSEAKNTKFVKGNFYEGKIKWKEIKIEFLISLKL